ncbi:conserved hypothetical protein [Candidatus Desulfosporosinus infrequens]|uniref:Uncharacterized protein n=1 Tax=Candidatus Desulfosporosinus infrequens TaxID=2043169 RepID=A0A2U3LL79_9FIRM|nr:conserved hypothetical protein [Candidatus Desulfosporosinus infrequens]
MELTVVGVIIVILLIIVEAGGKNVHIIIALLGMILLGMVMLNWSKVGPLLVKGGS